MSWNIDVKGTRSEVTAALKADIQAPYVPESVSLVIEEITSRSPGRVRVNTFGHIAAGPQTRSEVHVIVDELAEENGPEPAKEEAPAGGPAGQ